MISSIEFEPLVPYLALIIGGGLALLGVLIGAALGLSGWILRTLAALALIAALANPSIVREEREPLSDIAVMLVDRSESMEAGNRAAAADSVAAAIRQYAENDDSLELVEAEIPRDSGGTRPFEALSGALAEVPRDRLAAVIDVTDGQAQDAPEDPDALELGAPFHAVLVGDPEADDRRLEIVRAPSFGLVSEPVSFVVKVIDPAVPPGTYANVSLSVDGDEPVRARARVGEESEVLLPLGHRGPNIVEVTVAEGPEELTLINNRAALSITGVRDRLRVLLVTGEPHQGARDWRNLLKSDPSVDLVHFTILRPPQKDDRTPIDELSLIQFPTTQLFVEKLDEFDLIIFDRYKRRGVLPPLYLDNVARYVEDGGALLVAAGPPFAGPLSLSRSMLASVLPARPTGRVGEQRFAPGLTEAGRIHPVTAGFAEEAADDWGPWFRIVEAEAVSGDTLMSGPDDRPLMVLDRVGEGRVGLLLSDQAWLWARGYEDGGPYRELFRRVAHWLMKEPELEEERLSARIEGETAIAELRTMGEAPEGGTMTAPNGEETPLEFSEVSPGRYRAEMAVGGTGLHRFRAGELTAVAAAGALNPAEFENMKVDGEALAPVANATGGGVVFAGEQGEAPQMRRVREGYDAAGREWIGFKRNERYRVAERESTPAAPALLMLALVLLLTGGAWRREGQ